ncbi:uncharacterized protein EDB91DRAFT_1144902 [Suillus paluster]|uniref:uncharacterized protein n=1 Tax=Suillus paluster TaxID=48578 RepID=UPI001B85B82E|nr:uncharacterized protein EDB91DRAFT_1144902 [Suillus paluster]KAG1735330.1 hypothetical protein EDB91DRAFT_1144902 [Suillus paluster]
MHILDTMFTYLAILVAAAGVQAALSTTDEGELFCLQLLFAISNTPLRACKPRKYTSVVSKSAIMPMCAECVGG